MPIPGISTRPPATPIMSASIPETGHTTMPSASASIMAATKRIQKPPYRAAGAGEEYTGAAYGGCSEGAAVAGSAGPCGRGVTSGPIAAVVVVSLPNGLPQFAQNFASAEFCVPHRLQ